MNVPAERPDAAWSTPLDLPDSLRVAFIHPDLGIGGAERFVVDAAVALQKLGHDVHVFTSHHEDGPGGRSFEETRNGTLPVHVLGGWLFPMSVFGRLTIICAIARQLHLTFSFLLASLLHHLSFMPFVLPPAHPFRSSADWSWRRQLEPFDVIVVDQLSTSIPLLRWIGQNRVVFYCHFPDQLLSPSRPASHSSNDPRVQQPWTMAASVRSLYRAPIDALEESTTGEADKILVNSDFTSQVFQRTFASLRRIPRTVYPCVDVDAYGKAVEPSTGNAWLKSDSPTFLSINRFEKKKNVALAVEAFAAASETDPTIRLVVAGGFDTRLADNVATLGELQKLTTRLKLSHSTLAAASLKGPVPAGITIADEPPSRSTQVVFLLNMSNDQKQYLLSASSTVALLYTPSFEHFGIVPLEAMASRLPVVATTSGGPTETVIDNGIEDETTTGLLRDPRAVAWTGAINSLLRVGPERRRVMGQAGRTRVETTFSSTQLGRQLERACRDAASISRPIVTEVGFKKLLIFCSTFVVVVLAGAVSYYASVKGGRRDEHGRAIVGLTEMAFAERRKREKAKLRREIMKEVMKERILRGGDGEL